MRYLVLVENPADVHGCVIFLTRFSKDARAQFELHALTVVTPGDLAEVTTARSLEVLSVHVKEIAEQRLSIFNKELKHHGLHALAHVRSGDLEDTVLKLVDELAPDVLMLPRRGGDRLDDLFQGAQSQLIASFCTRPVMVIPNRVARH